MPCLSEIKSLILVCETEVWIRTWWDRTESLLLVMVQVVIPVSVLECSELSTL